MSWVKLFLVCVVLCFSAPVFSQQNEHELRKGVHPCGEPRLELNSITSYFEQRWQAHWADLKADAVDTYVAYHNAAKHNITVVRIFRSHMQPQLAVISAYRKVNFLNGKPLVDMFCIIELDGTLSLEYTPNELQVILGSGDVGA